MALRKITVRALPENPVEGEDPEVKEITVEVDGRPLHFVILKGHEPLTFSDWTVLGKRMRAKLGPNTMVISVENGYSIEIFEEVP